MNEDHDQTWDPLSQILDDIPGVLEDFMPTAGSRNMKRNDLDLHFYLIVCIVRQPWGTVIGRLAKQCS